MPFAGYTDHDDCVAKNSDKADPDAYCGTIRRQVEESQRRQALNEANISTAKEQEPEQVPSLTTPEAGDVKTEEPKDLISPPGSSKEADNPNVDTESPQDQAEPEENPQHQDKPATEQTTAPDSAYGNLNDEPYTKNEDELKDKKREEQQGQASEQEEDNGDKDDGDKDEGDKDKLEYNGETYHKVKAIEYNDEIYVQKDDKEEADEDDLEYEDKIYEPADEDVLELENDNDYYVKDEEQAPPTDLTQAMPTTALDIPELNPTMESVIIRESNGKYRKYNVFQANEEEDVDEKMAKLRGMKDGAKEQEDDSVIKPAEVEDISPTEQPEDKPAEQVVEPKTEPVEQKEPSEEIRAVEKIIIKEKGKLKFKSVFTEVKKKLRKMMQ